MTTQSTRTIHYLMFRISLLHRRPIRMMKLPKKFDYHAMQLQQIDQFRKTTLLPLIQRASILRKHIFESFFDRNFVLQVNPFYKILEKYNNQYPLVHFPKKMNIEIRMYNLHDLSNIALSVLFFMTIRSVSQKNFNHNSVEQQESNIADFVHSFKRIINRLSFVNAQGKDIQL